MGSPSRSGCANCSSRTLRRCGCTGMPLRSRKSPGWCSRGSWDASPQGACLASRCRRASSWSRALAKAARGPSVVRVGTSWASRTPCAEGGRQGAFITTRAVSSAAVSVREKEIFVLLKAYIPVRMDWSGQQPLKVRAVRQCPEVEPAIPPARGRGGGMEEGWAGHGTGIVQGTEGHPSRWGGWGEVVRAKRRYEAW